MIITMLQRIFVGLQVACENKDVLSRRLEAFPENGLY